MTGQIAQKGNSPLFYAEELGIKEPVVRIGLSGDDEKIAVSSNGAFRIIETATGLDIWKETYSGETLFLPFGTQKAGARIFRVQIGSYERKENADLVKQKVEHDSGFSAIVKYYPDRRIYRVRVGEGKSQQELVPVAAKLRELGYSEIWISEELPEWKGDIFIRVVDKDYVSEIAKTHSLIVFPANPSSAMQVNGNRYRGYIEIRAYPTGTVRAINILNIEDYLKGVVPLELGPEAWPEPEAQKAQAVAARTYVYKNLGQFEEEGFDICDSIRCQVYGGRDFEHPVSNKAIDDTYAVIAAYKGSPINALYTSTCGGMTEDGTNMFEEEKGEYLKAVECYPDRESLLSKTYTILSSQQSPLRTIRADAEFLKKLAYLLVHDILDEDLMKDGWEPKKMVKSDLILSMLCKAARLSRIEYRKPVEATVENRADFWKLAAEIFSLYERANIQISDKDTSILLPSPRSNEAGEEMKKLMAYCAREGIISGESLYSSSPSEKVTLDYLVVSISNLLEKFGGYAIEEGSFREFSENLVSFISAGSEKTMPLSAGIIIFNTSAGSVFPVDDIRFIPGEKFYYHLDAAGAIDYLEKKPPVKGTSNDRYSVNYAWSVTYSREEIERSVNEKVPVGELVDIQEVRRGRSGRVVEMKCIGSNGEYTIKGLNIRNALQLKENLFTMDKKRGPDGKLLSVTFTGKGWGHGVGLCQVGAYGMALRGKRYDEILKWYYTGIDLLQAYK